jgi:hypothetical protein
MLPIKILSLKLNTDDIEAQPQVTSPKQDEQLQLQTYTQSHNEAAEEPEDSEMSNKE